MSLDCQKYSSYVELREFIAVSLDTAFCCSNFSLNFLFTRFFPSLILFIHFILDFDTLTRLVKNVSLKVVENGGVVRSIRNHGIRDLPHRFRAKYPDTLGNRYYKKGRFLSIYYDASPLTMRQVESLISMDDTVLRQTHLKTRSKLDYVNVTNPKYNPYLRKVLAEEESGGSGGDGGGDNTIAFDEVFKEWNETSDDDDDVKAEKTADEIVEALKESK